MLGGQQQAAEQELVGQLFSAFCSSARKDFAAVFGGHSLSEAVLFLSLKLLWLIGSEHSLSPSLQDETLQNRIIDKISPKVKRGPAFSFLLYSKTSLAPPFSFPLSLASLQKRTKTAVGICVDYLLKTVESS